MPLGESFQPVLAAARTGAEWAWARIYREMAPAVLGYLRAQRAGEPEDLTGEVFLDVVRGIDSFEGDERGFRSWMFTIAHHRLLDDVRKRGRRIATIRLDETIIESAGPTGDAETEALGALTATEVLRVLDRLSPDQRAVMLLRIFGDLSCGDVAQALGKTEGAVKALQHRATNAVRSTLRLEGVTG